MPTSFNKKRLEIKKTLKTQKRHQNLKKPKKRFLYLCDEPSGRRARPRRYRQLRAVTARREIAAPPRHERRLVETRLQGRRHLRAAVCITGMVAGFYQCGR